MADSTAASKIWLASNDNAQIEVGKFSRHRGRIVRLALSTALRMLMNFPDRAVAERSMLIKNMLEDVGDESISQDTPIPIPNARPLPSQPPCRLLIATLG